MMLIKNKKNELKDKQTLAQLLQTGPPTAFLSCFFTFLFLQVHILVHIHRVWSKFDIAQLVLLKRKPLSVEVTSVSIYVKAF